MSLSELDGHANRSLLLVHGRGYKPDEESYLDVSLTAIRHGIERDYPNSLASFDAINKHLAWYGDLNAEILLNGGEHYDERLDLGDRKNALNALQSINARKKFGIQLYDRLPGKSALPEAVVGVLAPLLGSIGMCRPMIRLASKDFARYFDKNAEYAIRVRERLKLRLCELLDRDARIVLMSHGTGSVIAYDVLWQLSHDTDLKSKYGKKKVELWVTLGAPLGDRQIQKLLLGAKEKTQTKFPVNVIGWHNVAAEDDYTCHDNTLADDFKSMLKQHVVSSVHDHHVFNLAVRYGKSNPHSSIGYFVHPRVAKILADWLNTDT